MAAPARPTRTRPLRERFPHAGRLATLALVGVALVLLARQLREIEWAAVGATLRGFTWPSLAVALGLAAASHGLYASYELIGRHLTGHRLPARHVLTIGAASYALNLNLGALVGGFAARLRFYLKAGLRAPQATQLIGVSIVTNWVGYLALAGALLTLRPPALPPGWPLDGSELRGVGLAMMALAAVYLGACVIAPNRRWQWHGHELTTPSARIALMQLALSALNWLTIATLVWWVMERPVPLADVATVFLLAAVAGVVVHVPAGLGVLEAVFLALLSHRVPAAQLLAGLIVHRAVYYLLPLAVAGLLTWRLERRQRTRSGFTISH